MANDAGQSQPDLSKDANPLPTEFDFFELLRRLEEGGRLFGQAGRPDREPARLGQHVRLGFAVQDVASVEMATDEAPARVTVTNIGLLGPEGPMPLYLTRWVLDRLSQRWFATADMREISDTTFIDFVNVLQHRMIALFYRAWADAHPAVQVGRSGGGRIRALRAALAGLGLSGQGHKTPSLIDETKLRHAPALAHQIEGPERLTRFLADLLKVPVRLREFVGSWNPIPARLQSRLADAHVRLGRSATIGPRIFQRQQRIELALGPLTISDYMAFLPGSERRETLKRAIGDLVGYGLDVDVRLVLKRDEVPSARLGEARVGHTAWVAPGKDRSDADDLCMRTVNGWRPELLEAAEC
ncbi:type VI secretion system baseplate subunit TssG [Sinorhizobium saheli]|uniref:Type VI secretion protein n=1 Tax=Sinorhizobium saheli TaxID=36856 RepID=A0A178Y533_SINSA|nr:type VI secretion system baseplate subunit TssG [Sinorhizobium saheli]MQW89737.1 type VI secretion system baseplate subunit TssG [Sinorhizobium saheli]OAP42133.1 type VI secretion protein [Sinorhizobium saheli]